MKTYAVEQHDAAVKELDKLFVKNKKAAARISSAITSLADNPRPANSAKLTGFTRSLYVLTVGSHYRVVYEVRDKELRVIIAAAGPTENIYDTVRKRLKLK